MPQVPWIIDVTGFNLHMISCAYGTFCSSVAGLCSYQIFWPGFLVGGAGSYTQQWAWLWFSSLALVEANQASGLIRLFVWEFESCRSVPAEFPGQNVQLLFVYRWAKLLVDTTIWCCRLWNWSVNIRVLVFIISFLLLCHNPIPSGKAQENLL